MQHQHVLVLVHDQAAQEIALGIYHAEGGCAGHVLRAHGQGFANALLEKVLIDFHTLGCEHAHPDARLGIPVADAEQALAVVLHLHNAAVGRFAGHAEHAAFVEPRMSGEEAVGFTWLYQDGGQCRRCIRFL